MAVPTLYYDDPDRFPDHRYPLAADPGSARYVATIEDAGDDVPGRSVTLRYVLGGVLRWQGRARLLDPLTPVDGTHHYLYRNGVTERRFELAEGVPVGTEFHAFFDGGPCAELYYSRGLLQGVVTAWHADGARCSEIEYRDGERTGVIIAYHGNGAVRRRVRKVDGAREGLTVWYFENGNPQYIIPYGNDRPNGVVLAFYEDGMLRSEQPTVPGTLLEGTWRTYWPDGHPRRELTVRNGRPDGDEREWDADGRPAVHRVWADGRLTAQRV